jgi:ribosomal protein L14
LAQVFNFITRLFRSGSDPDPHAQLAAALAESARRDAEARKTAALAEAVKTLTNELALAGARESSWQSDAIERAHELVEARRMAGAGPWLVAEARTAVDQPGRLRVSEALTSGGGFGELELLLDNAEWRREVNWSWLEFSRWGIQQIILISRLYYIKNPIIRRLIDVDACYVFGRGVEVSSPDEAANAVLQDFLTRNQSVLGQVALSEHQKRTNYDGNLFFAFFSDTQSTGLTNVRLMDATEMQDIVTDPDDTERHWYYRRGWTQRVFNEATGATSTVDRQMWYPALGYDPVLKPAEINGVDVDWAHPVLHRKYGAVGAWTFGCPVIYPALDWAKAARKFLEACATVKQAISQIAMTVTTKGGQQALQQVQQLLGTTVGPNAPGYETNPPSIPGSTFASGPGTVLTAFTQRGKSDDPAEVKEFKTMAAIVVGVPPTFLGDLDTANLATATTLDRPTELGFLHKQESWREILATIATYVLSVSKGAAGGQLREALDKRKDVVVKDVVIREARRIRRPDGTSVYVLEAAPKPNVIEVNVNFPAIREGDIAALVTATVSAMTLGNSAGTVVGIDEKEAVRRLMDLLGIEAGDEIIETMYPSTGPDAYDPLRVKAEPVQPVAAPGAPVAGVPANGVPKTKAVPPKVKEAAARVRAALAVFEGV